MQHTQISLVTFILFFVGVIEVQAQDAIPTSGGEASGSVGSASYSVGQTVYTTISGTNGTATQGVQQPYEISIVDGLEELGINLHVSVYPNPTTDFLQLTIENENLKKFRYQLYDMNGKLLKNKKITVNETSIAFNNFLSATYYLKVIKGNKEVKTFKIIKN